MLFLPPLSLLSRRFSSLELAELLCTAMERKTFYNKLLLYSPLNPLHFGEAARPNSVACPGHVLGRACSQIGGFASSPTPAACKRPCVDDGWLFHNVGQATSTQSFSLAKAHRININGIPGELDPLRIAMTITLLMLTHTCLFCLLCSLDERLLICCVSGSAANYLPLFISVEMSP